jgi:ABC-type transport system involved in cytochrome bd biosynthesis fused ATPase/permease subunit
LTVLAITHQPAWVAVADKVIRLQDGLVSETAAAPIRLLAQ